MVSCLCTVTDNAVTMLQPGLLTRFYAHGELILFVHIVIVIDVVTN